MFDIGAFAIIFDESKKILFSHRRDSDFWNLPGGGAEEGEAPWQTVTREVKEETQLEVEILRLVGVYGKDYKNEIVFAFECKIIGGKLGLTDEADQHKYFAFKDIPKNTSLKQIERVKDALNKNDGIVMKIQKRENSI